MNAFPSMLGRKRSTNRNGASFDEATITAVWNKAQTVLGADPSVFRKDACGAWIKRWDYGKTVEDGTGWEIDHIMPVSRGGQDSVFNLQPLQWQNNRKKGDLFPITPAQYRAVSARRA